MAHRIYIYLFQSDTGESYPHYLGEWNYEIPALLTPLFSANLRCKGTQLYADRVAGIAALRGFYTLLDDVYQLGDSSQFKEASEQMFDFLEALPFDTFQINGADVFNMNEEKPRQQAKEWVEQIHEQVKLYELAVQTNTLTPLHEIIKSFGYDSFLEALQTEWVNFGLGYWNEDVYKSDYIEVFIENGLQGLKDEQGKELVPPIYQTVADVFDIYYADENDNVLSLRGSIVSANEKYGLLAIPQNLVLIPLIYEELSWITNNYFNAKIAGKYHLIDHENIDLLQITSEEPFHYEYPNLFFLKTKGTAKRTYYSNTGIYLGEHLEESLRTLPNNYYYVKTNKLQKKIAIIKPDGTRLANDIDQLIATESYQSLAYCKGKEWLLYDTVSHKKLADKISIKGVSIPKYAYFFKDIYILNTNEGTGLYGANQAKWHVEPSNALTKIEHLDNQFLKIHFNKGMMYWDDLNQELSANFTYVSEAIDRNNYQLLVYRNRELLGLLNNNELSLILPEELGKMYISRHTLGADDLMHFVNFFTYWKAKEGADYYKNFDNETCYQLGVAMVDKSELDEAVAIFEFGASRNHALMMTELGILYADEDNANYYNPEKATTLYKRAAALDEKNAWNNLGYHLQNGLGIAKHIPEAIAAYSKAGELGNGLGYTNLGDLYYYGECVEKNYDTALAYYLKAEKRHYPNTEKLASIYFEKEEYKKVLSLLKKDYNQTFSAIYYALMYEEGLGGLKINIKKAISYYEQALAKSDYPFALQQLLNYYGKGGAYENEEKYNAWLLRLES